MGHNGQSSQYWKWSKQGTLCPLWCQPYVACEVTIPEFNLHLIKILTTARLQTVWGIRKVLDRVNTTTSGPQHRQEMFQGGTIINEKRQQICINQCSLVWGYTSGILVLGRPRKEDYQEFEVSLSDKTRQVSKQGIKEGSEGGRRKGAQGDGSVIKMFATQFEYLSSDPQNPHKRSCPWQLASATPQGRQR